MQYKLIHKKTGEETICSKIELDGFDYYVGKEISIGSIFIANQGLFKCIEIVNGDYPYKSYLLSDKNNIQWHSKNWKYKSAIIATNNPNIDVFQAIDEVYNISIELGQEVYIGGNYDFENGVRKGYNKAKETYRYTEKDMVEFAEWIANSKLHGHCKQLYEAMIVNKVKTAEELLEIWNNQRLVSIYYE